MLTTFVSASPRMKYALASISRDRSRDVHFKP